MLIDCESYFTVRLDMYPSSLHRHLIMSCAVPACTNKLVQTAALCLNPSLEDGWAQMYLYSLIRHSLFRLVSLSQCDGVLFTHDEQVLAAARSCETYF